MFAIIALLITYAGGVAQLHDSVWQSGPRYRIADSTAREIFAKDVRTSAARSLRISRDWRESPPAGLWVVPDGRHVRVSHGENVPTASARNLGFSQSHLDRLDKTDVSLLALESVGWPLPFMQSEFIMHEWHTHELVAQQKLQFQGKKYTLPLRPLWLPLFVNTALFMTISLYAIEFVARLRQTVRSAYGRCAQCGYPVSTDVCPECGNRF